MKNIFKKNVVLIVSGFSSGRYLAPLFNGRGYDCIHITSTSQLNNAALNKNYSKTDYISTIKIDSENDYKTCIQKLKNYHVILVIAGSEPGVVMSDRLSEFFNTPRNLYHLSEARRNKYFMHETLRSKKITCANQVNTSDLNEALDFFYRVNSNRIVLKPLASASSDNVFYCDTENQVKDAFEIIHNKKNILDEVNETVLVQEYLQGKQYIVNAVSSNGKHFFTDIWEEVHENDNIPSNDIYATLMQRNDILHEILSRYTESVLNALGIRYGASHSEIRITASGPCLIEIASRLPGNVDFSVTDNLLGFSQISLIPDAFLNPNLFNAIVSNVRPNKKFVRLVYLFSKVEGLVYREPSINFFMQYESVQSIGLHVHKGEYLYKTNRALRNPRPGFLYLANENSDQLKIDYEKIKITENDFYLSFLESVDE